MVVSTTPLLLLRIKAETPLMPFILPGKQHWASIILVEEKIKNKQGGKGGGHRGGKGKTNILSPPETCLLPEDMALHKNSGQSCSHDRNDTILSTKDSGRGASHLYTHEHRGRPARKHHHSVTAPNWVDCSEYVCDKLVSPHNHFTVYKKIHDSQWHSWFL